jgi:hypothetical protein
VLLGELSVSTDGRGLSQSRSWPNVKDGVVARSSPESKGIGDGVNRGVPDAVLLEVGVTARASEVELSDTVAIGCDMVRLVEEKGVYSNAHYDFKLAR